MPDTKISALSDAGALAGSEIVPLANGGANERTTTQTIADLAAFRLLSTQIASSSANLAFTGLDSSTIRYMLVLDRLIAASNDNLILEMGTGAGPTYQTSNYRYVQPFWATATVAASMNRSEAATSILLSGITTSVGIIGQYMFMGSMCFGMNYTLASDAHDYFSNFGARWTGGSSFTALRLRLSGGANIASGSASLYRLA